MLITWVILEIKIVGHVRTHYPDFWQSISVEKLGVKASISRPLAINEAIYFGELSKKQDKKIANYKLFHKYGLIIFFIIIVTSELLNFIQH